LNNPSFDKKNIRLSNDGEEEDDEDDNDEQLDDRKAQQNNLPVPSVLAQNGDAAALNRPPLDRLSMRANGRNIDPIGNRERFRLKRDDIGRDQQMESVYDVEKNGHQVQEQIHVPKRNN
jgi:hypothetical protein